MCAFAAAVSYDEFDIRSSVVIKCCTVYARLCWNVVVCFVVILLFSALMFASFPFFFFFLLYLSFLRSLWERESEHLSAAKVSSFLLFFLFTNLFMFRASEELHLF